MKTLLLRLVLATMCMVAAASANAQAGDWGNFVFVSSTLGNNANKLCLGEGLRGSDIGCPTYAPTVLPGGYVGIGNNTPTVALSVNGEVQVSNSSVACSGSTKGSIRYSTTSNTLEYCNSTAWTGLTNSTDASLTAFTVVKTSTQSLATTGSLVTWDSVVTNNGSGLNLATERFTAPANGYYFFVFSAINNADTSFGDFYLYKNGTNTALRAYGGQGSEIYKSSTLQGVLFLSAGDYVDIRSSGSSMSLYGAAGGPVTTFSGFLLNAGSGTSSGGSGVSAMASLTDVQLINLAGRDYLRYDQPSGKWVNISESAVMSTTTMVSGWPDAIECRNASYRITLYHRLNDLSASGTHYYVYPDQLQNINIGYTPAGAYSSHANATGYDCLTSTLSISQLYARGQAFNFIGSANTSSTALGDRITSGTSAVTVNSATSYISLTTGGVDWGYLNSGLSYLPRLNAANISASYVSSTLTQVSGTSLACSTALKGSIRYSNTSNTLEYCNSTAWVSAGPSATQVPAFYVNKGGTNQTVTNSVWTLLTWSTEVYDTNNNFTANTFTPTIPGKYIFTLNVDCSNGSNCYGGIFKNGVIELQTQKTGNNGAVSAVLILDMNGTTDYVQGYVHNAGGTGVAGIINTTNFGGALISMAGGVGGTATPAGATGDLQFNNAGALAADTGKLTYTSATGIISTTGISATLISTSLVQLSSPSGGIGCTMSTINAIRVNSITGAVQLCRQ